MRVVVVLLLCAACDVAVVDDEPTPEPECASSRDCASGLCLVDGTCVVDECRSNGDCGVAESCVDNHRFRQGGLSNTCEPPGARDEVCFYVDDVGGRFNKPCAEGLACIHEADRGLQLQGECVPPDGLVLGEVCDGGGCVDDDDLHCGEGVHRCRRVIGGACASGDDCEDNVCFDGVCSVQCNSDDSCESGQCDPSAHACRQ